MIVAVVLLGSLVLGPRIDHVRLVRSLGCSVKIASFTKEIGTNALDPSYLIKANLGARPNDLPK